MRNRTRIARAAAVAVALVSLAAGASTAGASDKAGFPGLQKRLTGQSKLLVAFTTEFRADAEQYNKLAATAGYDYAALWATQAAAVKPLLAEMKRDWLKHNSDYERMEGIVAGTPSLVQYDVIIDAGASFEEDPESAVRSRSRRRTARPSEQPGTLYNLTEGALWGDDPALSRRASSPISTATASVEFGEVLPDAALPRGRDGEFDRQSHKLLDARPRPVQPTTSDALTALVVMVPTMSEYFGAVEGLALRRRRQGRRRLFNVVSRLTDIHDILGSLQVVYTACSRSIAKVDPDAGRADRARSWTASPRSSSDLPARGGRPALHAAGRRHARHRGAGRARQGDRRARSRRPLPARDQDRTG